MTKKVKETEDCGKHVYEVTFYWHSNSTVVVASDKELSDEEAIEMARNMQQDNEQIIGGLQEDNTPDVCEVDSEDYAFDRDGRIIHHGDSIMWHDSEWDENYILKVYEVAPEMVKAKASWGSEFELFPNEVVVVSV